MRPYISNEKVKKALGIDRKRFFFYFCRYFSREKARKDILFIREKAGRWGSLVWRKVWKGWIEGKEWKE